MAAPAPPDLHHASTLTWFSFYGTVGMSLRHFVKAAETDGAWALTGTSRVPSLILHSDKFVRYQCSMGMLQRPGALKRWPC